MSLTRFVDAQPGIYEQALAELLAGRKRGHWMWFVFPQLQGLGRSATSRYYGLESLAEARFYLDHPLLGARLRECTAALLHHRDKDAETILGPVDAMKLRSSMTLFDAAGGERALFGECLDVFFGGAKDPATLQLLERVG